MGLMLVLAVILTASLVMTEQEITENCIPYRGYCVTSDAPCCWKREAENGLVQYIKMTCDFLLRTCNTFGEIYKFNETSDFIERNRNNEDLEILYEKWLDSLQNTE